MKATFVKDFTSGIATGIVAPVFIRKGEVIEVELDADNGFSYQGRYLTVEKIKPYAILEFGKGRIEYPAGFEPKTASPAPQAPTKSQNYWFVAGGMLVVLFLVGLYFWNRNSAT